jgi:hypothetical protein
MHHSGSCTGNSLVEPDHASVSWLNTLDDFLTKWGSKLDLYLYIDIYLMTNDRSKLHTMLYSLVAKCILKENNSNRIITNTPPLEQNINFVKNLKFTRNYYNN